MSFSASGGKGGSAPRDPVARIEQYVERVTESGCWIWMASCNPKGYGHFTLNNRAHQAHRASYLLHRGDIPVGLMVLHRCDVPQCVNPAHLRLGTHRENMRDATQKGRIQPTRASGVENGRAKLTASQVVAIAGSSELGVTLAARYGVTPTVISRIRSGKSWQAASGRSHALV